MPSVEGAEQGAQAGAMAGPWGMAAGALLGGLFGGQAGKLPPELQQLYGFQLANAQKLQDFANSAPLSSPQELMALAQQRGELGNEQRNQQSRLFATMPFQAGGPNAANAGALMSNLTNQQTGQRMGLLSQAVQDALNRRQQALFSASSAAAAASYPAMGQRIAPANPAAAFAQMAQEQARQRARQQAMGSGGNTGGTKTDAGGSGMDVYSTGGGQAGGYNAPQDWGGPAGGGVAAMSLPGMGSPPMSGGPMPTGGMSAGLNLPPMLRAPSAGGGFTPGNSPFQMTGAPMGPQQFQSPFGFPQRSSAWNAF